MVPAPNFHYLLWPGVATAVAHSHAFQIFFNTQNKAVIIVFRSTGRFFATLARYGWGRSRKSRTGSLLQIGFVGKDRYMATILQIEANRRNALKSTGPRTPEGKSAVRMNALKHGLRARTVVLPSENAEEFHQLCDDLEAEWQPQSRTEQFYLEQMAVSQWKLNRMEVGEYNVFTADTGAKSQLPMLDTLWRAQCRLERSYARAERELERVQKSRRRQTATPADIAEQEPEVAQALSTVESAPATAPGDPPSMREAAPAPAAASPRVEPTSDIQDPTSNCDPTTTGAVESS